MTAGLFDFILAPVLVILACQMLRVKDLFTGIVLYMVFGLLMALTWIQLRAPDIALVEAAIGSGVIGALFLGALGRLEDTADSVKRPAGSLHCSGHKAKSFIGILCVLLGVILTASALNLPEHTSGLSGWVNGEMPQSGVNNPVTAVILNFRAYDTLLEVGVLILALLASASLIRFALIKTKPVPASEKLLDTFVFAAIPFMVLIAGYLLWAGSDKPGGAFQAGAIFSGAGVLALLAGRRVNFDIGKVWFRVLLTVGFFTFLIAGIVVMGNGAKFLEYPPESAKFLILFIEAMAAVSIAGIFIYSFKICSGFLMDDRSSANSKEDGGS